MLSGAKDLFVFLEGIDPRCFAPLNMTRRKASTLLENQAFSIAWNLKFEALFRR
jgi:hypothetical protein